MNASVMLYRMVAEGRAKRIAQFEAAQKILTLIAAQGLTLQQAAARAKNAKPFSYTPALPQSHAVPHSQLPPDAMSQDPTQIIYRTFPHQFVKWTYDRHHGHGEDR